LKEFFSEGEKPVWRVRNLTGMEIFIVNEAMERNSRKNEAIEAIMSGERKERVEAMKEIAMTLPGMTPTEYVRRLETLCLGSVEPKVTKEIAVKIAENFGNVFTYLSNRILILTSQGAEPGK
jgi:hypothetical protein